MEATMTPQIIYSPEENAQIEIRNFVNDGIRDMQEGNLLDFNETFEELRERYQNA